MTAKSISVRNRWGRFAAFRRSDPDIDLLRRGPLVVAADTRTYPETLQELSLETDVGTRLAVAGNKSAPEVAIARLIDDANPTVRAAAATHPSVSNARLRLMLRDPDVAVVGVAGRLLNTRGEPAELPRLEFS